MNIYQLLTGGQFPDSGILNDYAKLAAAGEFHLPITRMFPLDG